MKIAFLHPLHHANEKLGPAADLHLLLPVCTPVTPGPCSIPCTGVISLTVSQREDASTVYTARRKKKGEDRNVMDSCSDISRHGLRLVTRSLSANKAEREEQDTNGINGKHRAT